MHAVTSGDSLVDSPVATGAISTTRATDVAGDGEYAAIRIRSTAIVARTLADYRRRRDGGSSGSGSGSGSRSGTTRRAAASQKTGLFSEAELAKIEASYSDGVTALQVVEIFGGRGVRLSEASFRKYIQLGLLPRSRRVGRKGKHRGSMGVYPAKTVRRINQIKRLMEEGHTIEEIQDQFLRFSDVMEVLGEGFSDLFELMREELLSPRFDNRTRRTLEHEIAETRAMADELLERLGTLSNQVSQGKGDEYRNAGAAGSAEDLL